MRLTRSAIAALMLVAAPVTAQTSANAFRGPVTTTQVTAGVYQLSAGSNAVLVIGRKEAVLIDSLFYNPENVAAAVKAITPLPVKYVISTHAHRDHTGANATFAKLGARIISTPAAAARMAKPSVNMRGETDPPIDRAGWPTRTYAKPTTIKAADQLIRFIPVGPSHSDGDAMVFLPEANVLILGDLHHSHEYPVYDAQSGCKCGSYDGNLLVYEQGLKLANDDTRIIAGHGGVTNKAEVTAYVAMLRSIRDKVRSMIAQGMTKEQVVAAKPLAGDRTPHPGGPDNADAFIGTLYTALKTGEGI